ncbi:MAG: glycosyltransferase [Bacteroides sp.]|nr:glycosyltransferase [Bacteroides sp.]
MKNTNLSFCITCRNRLHHLQDTLEVNIRNNRVAGKTEFVLLDYNSTDGLEEWVHSSMINYIEEGTLVYYKTFEPVTYLRSHSRNVAFRLAGSDILCMLDADNYLGEGFASFMLGEFEQNKNIFYTSDLTKRDAFGRVCVKREDFISVRGYNEEFVGYGYEDVDFFYRLKESGVEQKFFFDPEFYQAIRHIHKERILEEPMFARVNRIYISYLNPYTSVILVLYTNLTVGEYTLVDNLHLFANLYIEDIVHYYMDERKSVVLSGDIKSGNWREFNNQLIIDYENTSVVIDKQQNKIEIDGSIFYHVDDEEIKIGIIMTLTSAQNFRSVQG